VQVGQCAGSSPVSSHPRAILGRGGGARIIRNRQGIDLSLINKEIPVEWPFSFPSGGREASVAEIN
jgi:hypothetical protein